MCTITYLLLLKLVLINYRNISSLQDTQKFGNFFGGLCHFLGEKNDGKIRIWRKNLVLIL
jgi:hypothetical protein